MIVSHNCQECGYSGDAPTEGRKVTCPQCGTVNDWWIEGETPPVNHRGTTLEPNTPKETKGETV